MVADWRGGWAALTKAERNAAYDNNSAVADSPSLIAARNEAAQAYRARYPAGLDRAYGELPRQKWDLFPADDVNAPTLVFIHGGYWQRNSREDFAHLAEGIRAHGWAAALPSHTLAPEVSLSAIAEEINRALDWLHDKGPSEGIAGGKIVLSGWSAGGHLTAHCLAHPAVTAGLAVSGVYELGPIRDTGLNDNLKLTDEELARLSPLRQPVVQKPMSIAYGSLELPALVGDARALHEKRAAAHAVGDLIPVAGANHFTILDELQRPDGVLVKTVRALAG
ncbi:MAG: alpha/beta hydrolase [Hyphomicrobiaceae bacterium]